MAWSSSPTPTTSRVATGWSVTPVTTARPKPTGWQSAPRVQVTSVPMTAAAQTPTPALSVSPTVTAVAMTAVASTPVPVFIVGVEVSAAAATATTTDPAISVDAAVAPSPAAATADIAPPAVYVFEANAFLTAVPLFASVVIAGPELASDNTVTVTAMAAGVDMLTPSIGAGDNTGFPYTFGFPLGVGATGSVHISAPRMFATAALPAPSRPNNTFPYTWPFPLG